MTHRVITEAIEAYVLENKYRLARQQVELHVKSARDDIIVTAVDFPDEDGNASPYTLSTTFTMKGMMAAVAEANKRLPGGLAKVVTKDLVGKILEDLVTSLVGHRESEFSAKMGAGNAVQNQQEGGGLQGDNPEPSPGVLEENPVQSQGDGTAQGDQGEHEG